MRFIILIVALTLFGPGDGKKKGRRANALYEKEQFTEAAGLYRDGIFDIQENGPGSLHAGLLNNLGASLFRQGEFEQAASAFSGSFRMAPTLEESVRADYNAGNALAMQQKLQGALEHYRSALLSNPENENAKFNYEFVKRQLEEQQQQQDQNQDSEQQQDQEQQQDEKQDNSEQNDQQEQQPSENQDPSESDQQRQNPEEMSQEEAQRILQALENEEEQLLRQIQKMKARPRRVEKDW